METQENPWRKTLTPKTKTLIYQVTYEHGDTDDFENVENEYHTQWRNLTNKVDHLQHKVEATEGQPTEAINCLEHELHRLSLALCPSALPEPLHEVLQQCTEILYTAQKKSTFMNTLLQDITIFNGSNSSHLEDWLIDVETAATTSYK